MFQFRVPTHPDLKLFFKDSQALVVRLEESSAHIAGLKSQFSYTYVSGLSSQEWKKKLDFTQKLQRNNTFCFIRSPHFRY
jgi:hypothetical protein